MGGVKVQSVLIATVIAFLLVAIPATSAQATPTTLARFGSGAGRVAGPAGVAVDQANGMVYVADKENHRVDEFEAGGKFVRAFGFGVLNGAEEPQVCTLETGCHQGGTGEGAGEIRPFSVAVDAGGDVYVSDTEKYRIEKFSATGEFLLLFGKEVNKTKVEEREQGNVAITEPEENVCTKADLEGHDVCGRGSSGTAPGELANEDPPLALDASGDVWVGDVNRLEEFGPEGAFLKEVNEVPLSGAGTIEALAVEGDPAVLSGHFYVKSSEVPGVQQLEPSGASVLGDKYPVDTAGEPRALGLDPATGDVFVVDGKRAAARVFQYEPSGTQLEAFGAGEVTGTPEGDALAVDDKDQSLYVASSAGSRESVVQVFGSPAAGPLVEPAGSTTATEIHKTSATLNSSLDPENKATSYKFQYIDDADFKAEGGFAGARTLTTPETSLVLEGDGFEEQPVSAALAAGKLTPGTLYHFRVLANGVPVGEEATFETQPSAAVESTSVTEVTSTAATLDAKIDPLGDATTYHFEYISEAAYLANHDSFEGASPATKVPSVEVAIGSGNSTVEVAPEPISGLTPGTVYHYRVVARNAVGSEPGPEHTFTTHTAALFSLIDDRQWEMVSPPNKYGALIEPIGAEGLIQAAANGEAISYHANEAIEPAPPGIMNQVQALSTRTSSGWSSRDLEIPHGSVTDKPEGEGEEYRFFNEDLSTAVVQPAGAFLPCTSAEGAPQPCLSPEASEQTAFSHDLETGAFRPLVTGCPAPGTPCAPGVEEHANIPAGTTFGGGIASNREARPCPFAEAFCGPKFVGASPDAEHVVFSSYAQLTAVKTPPVPQEELYEWSAGKLALVTMLPGEAGPVPGGEAELGFEGVYTRHAVSDDGSRVFWSILSGHLYMRDLAHGQTVLGGETIPGETLQLDVPESGAEGGGVSPEFQFASPDGSRVFFTDAERLTTDSGAGSSGTGSQNQDLYECVIVVGAGGRDECRLTDLTPETETRESADVQGAIVGASENGCDAGSAEGCYVYFVANSVLSGKGSGAVPGDCSQGNTPPDALCNLYVRHDGVTHLVAVLSGEDKPDWANGGGLLFSDLSARVSPDGRWLSFMSDRDLTGYDPTDSTSGHADEEVYLYNAETGRISCASCDPSGGRPEGVPVGGNDANDKLVGGDGGWKPSSWLAATVPGWTPFALGSADYQSRYLSNTGRLFFNSHDALVPRDVNGQWDVYEYEPEGTASPEGKVQCSEGSSSGGDVFKPAKTATVEGRTVTEGAGCVGLISSGSSAEESAFLDASESGGDVFFLTTAKLEPQDYDNAFDIYDAHECTTQSPCIAPPGQNPPPCETAESCRGAQSPQPGIFGQPPSATFNGQGNLSPLCASSAGASSGSSGSSAGGTGSSACGSKPAAPSCSSSLGAPSTKCSKKQNLTKALATCKRKYPKNKKKRVGCEATARKHYGSKPAKKSKAKK